MHLHSYSVKYDIPVGYNSLSKSSTTDSDASESEKKEFDNWLMTRWREKDQRLQLFLNEGKLSKGMYVDIPLKMRNARQVVGLLASCIFGLWITKWGLKILWRILV